jgi:deazaflavin-dependent oxidoreductase (nitroreductase family)
MTDPRRPRIGRRLARFNRACTNHLTRRLAGHLPLFGVVVHTGRSSGRTYRTPVNVFETESGFRVALTYGRDAEWVRNVIHAGRARLVTSGREHVVVDPRIVNDPRRHHVPGPMRLVLALLRVDDFLDLTAATTTGDPAPGQGRSA